MHVPAPVVAKQRLYVSYGGLRQNVTCQLKLAVVRKVRSSVMRDLSVKKVIRLVEIIFRLFSAKMSSC